jgi:hypothetical protein
MDGNRRTNRENPMNCYGYVRSTAAETPSELEEVTIQCDPTELRSIARFLLHVAEQMESHGDKFGHEHFEDFCPRPAAECRLIVTAG